MVVPLVLMNRHIKVRVKGILCLWNFGCDTRKKDNCRKHVVAGLYDVRDDLQYCLAEAVKHTL